MWVCICRKVYGWSHVAGDSGAVTRSSGGGAGPRRGHNGWTVDLAKLGVAQKPGCSVPELLVSKPILDSLRGTSIPGWPEGLSACPLSFRFCPSTDCFGGTCPRHDRAGISLVATRAP